MRSRILVDIFSNLVGVNVHKVGVGHGFLQAAQGQVQFFTEKFDNQVEILSALEVIVNNIARIAPEWLGAEQHELSDTQIIQPLQQKVPTGISLTDRELILRNDEQYGCQLRGQDGKLGT